MFLCFVHGFDPSALTLKTSIFNGVSGDTGQVVVLGFLPLYPWLLMLAFVLGLYIFMDCTDYVCCILCSAITPRILT